jgi:hypothetical protein
MEVAVPAREIPVVVVDVGLYPPGDLNVAAVSHGGLPSVPFATGKPAPHSTR